MFLCPPDLEGGVGLLEGVPVGKTGLAGKLFGLLFPHHPAPSSAPVIVVEGEIGFGAIDDGNLACLRRGGSDEVSGLPAGSEDDGDAKCGDDGLFTRSAVGAEGWLTVLGPRNLSDRNERQEGKEMIQRTKNAEYACGGQVVRAGTCPAWIVKITPEL